MRLTILLPCVHLTTLKIKIWWGVLGIRDESSIEARSGDIQRGSLLLESCSSQISAISLQLAPKAHILDQEFSDDRVAICPM